MTTTMQEGTHVVKQAQETLQRIQNWPHWEEIAAGAQKEYGLTPEQFQERLPEYQRFLALCAISPGLGMTSEAIDQLWHSHILNTARYDEFCADIIGRKLHHLPCSSYVLYGVEPGAAESDCSDCTTCKLPTVPSTCYGQQQPGEDARQSILHAGEHFRGAYQAVFGDLPSIWEHPRRTHSTDGMAI